MNLMILAPTESAQALALPLFLEIVPCGFPSPAQDYVETELDLNEYCIRHRSAPTAAACAGRFTLLRRPAGCRQRHEPGFSAHLSRSG